MRETREAPETYVVVLRAGCEENFSDCDIVVDRLRWCQTWCNEGEGSDPVGMAFESESFGELCANSEIVSKIRQSWLTWIPCAVELV